MPLLTRPHCELYYELHGDPDSPHPPLVFAHGLGGNYLSWWQQLAHFAPTRRCLVFSHRGFARSPETTGGPGLAGFADDLLALLAHLARGMPPLPAHVSPAAGLRLAREQPAMNLLYNQISGLTPDLDRSAFTRTLLAARTLPLATLRAPLLCLAADEDLLIPADAVAWLAGHVPGARLHREPNAGHSLYWERPATFNRVLAEFLDELQRR